MSKSNTKVMDVIRNPWKIIKHYGGLGYFKWIPDELYIKICYRAAFGKWPNLDNPTTFNEKLNWLKLHDHKPIYTKMVDKYEAKKYVADIIGDEYIIPTLGVWEHFEDIDFEKLPNQFVLKCTHDSGGVVICQDKNTFDKLAAQKIIEKSLKREFYYVAREWPYKNVRPRIIAEEYMVDESQHELKDYKVFNFNGEPKIIQVDYDRFLKHRRDLYNVKWEKLECLFMYETKPNHEVIRPHKLTEMLNVARKLAEGHPFIRTDFYSIGDKIYFGEMTFYPEAGFGIWSPRDMDEEIGEWLEIE